MSKIPDTVLDQINLRLSAVDIIGEHVTLTSKGGKHWGLCPFHHEKTPSFSVDGDKNLFYCFGCHKGGSMITFLMDLENITFHDAVEKLADKAGIVIPKSDGPISKQEEEAKKLFDLYEKLTSAFQYILHNSPEGEKAKSYLLSRGVDDKSINNFRLGYAPADINWLYSFLTKKGYSPQFLKSSGLFSQNHPKYPLFAGRIMFPVIDTRQRVIAFGGRDLTGREKAPKYINSPESSIYRKRSNLFGLHRATPWMRKEGKGVLCEGNFDVVALHQAGIEGAIAPLGTAFTEGQVQVLKRYVSEIVIFFDSDNAGIQATLKAIQLLEAQGIVAMVVSNRSGKDPADLLLSAGPKGIQELLAQPTGGIEYLINHFRQTQEIQTPRGKERFLQQIAPYIEVIPSEVRKISHFEQIANLLGVSVQTILEDIKDQRKKPRVHQIQKKEGPETTAPSLYNPRSHEQNLLFAVVANPELFSYLRDRINYDEFTDPWAKILYIGLEECFRINETSTDILLNHIENKELHRYILEAVQSDRFSLNPKEYVRQAVDTVLLQHLEARERVIISAMEQAAKRGDHEKESHLLIEKMYIDEEKKKLKKQRMVVDE